MSDFNGAASRALDGVFRVFGQSATYTPSGGDPVTVTVLASRPRRSGPEAGAGVRAALGVELEQDLASCDIRVVDATDQGIGRPVTADRIAFGGVTYAIRRVELDAERVTWRLVLAPLA